MKNAVFRDITTQFVPHRKHMSPPLQSPAGYCCVIFEVFTVVTIKNAAFWGVRCVALVRTDVSVECIASIVRVTRSAS
jgi:hypothetical protein